MRSPRADWHVLVAALGFSVGLVLWSVAFAHSASAQIAPNGRGRFQGIDAKPEAAAPAIIAAFDAYQVVGVGAAHGNKDLDDFLISLIRHPAFPTAVNDIVVECGNSRYQAILDRYIAGETVALSEVRQV
jgi:hypothetical protein